MGLTATSLRLISHRLIPKHNCFWGGRTGPASSSSIFLSSLSPARVLFLLRLPLPPLFPIVWSNSSPNKSSLSSLTLAVNLCLEDLGYRRKKVKTLIEFKI